MRTIIFFTLICLALFFFCCSILSELELERIEYKIKNDIRPHTWSMVFAKNSLDYCEKISRAAHWIGWILLVSAVCAAVFIQE